MEINITKQKDVNLHEGNKTKVGLVFQYPEHQLFEEPSIKILPFDLEN